MSLWLWIALAVLLVAALWWWRQQKASNDAEPSRSSMQDALDTVAAWPPEATRVLSGDERNAHQAVVAALPECLVLAQVPLARFIKVPRRHSYTEWLTRAGHLCADLLICDRASQALAVIIIRSPHETERGAKRNQRIKRVLNGAKLKVVFWKEGVIPARDAIRDALLPSTLQVPLTGPVSAARPAAPTREAAPTPPAAPPGDDLDLDAVEPRREPPPSTWFDDVESRPAPLTDRPPPGGKPPAR